MTTSAVARYVVHHGDHEIYDGLEDIISCGYLELKDLPDPEMDSSRSNPNSKKPYTDLLLLVWRMQKKQQPYMLLNSWQEVGIQGSALVSVGRQFEDETDVRVEEAHPHNDVLSLKEV
ncbi:ribonuclease II, chloroplastic/mitochondrial-like [Magnolia sinica]|uniref:ribonuclease II, chloroplastic/mitochondrial-like n=1 Tax=Magnolia sinica TaxID=86752 RepID=UPI002659AAD2|nr:ribonuclease II, chloroplastic/mitochondrial-like [Magnolia sinica]